MCRSPRIIALAALALLAPLAAEAQVVISQFRVRGTGGANDEFIELHNPTTAAVDISGWRVMGSNDSGGTSVRLTVASGKSIPAGGFFLVTNSLAYSGTVTADASYSASNLGINDKGGIALLKATGTTAVDAIGLSSGSAYKEGTPITHHTTDTNKSYRRKQTTCGWVTDTGNNSSDFEGISPSVPRNHSTPALVSIAAGQACNDGSLCTSGDVCSGAGACVGTAIPAGGNCDDGNACTSADKCNASGVCAGVAVAAGGACNDGIDCTDNDVCNAAGVCKGEAFTAGDSCDDGKACTANDVCDAAGKCGGTRADVGTACNDGTACTEDDICNAAGACVGTAVDVNDDNPCTADSCNPTTGAVTNAPTPGAACDDGNACTTGSTCDADAECLGGTAIAIVDDHNPCTEDACDPDTGMTHTPLAGETCDDGNLCTLEDICSDAGVCGGTAKVCVAGEGACVSGSACVPATGECKDTYKAAGVTCDDEEACTQHDVCNGAGACHGTTVTCENQPPECVDGKSRTFTAGVCVGAGACDFTETDTACAFGCNATSGLCNGDPCTGVTCNTPPSQCHAAVGTCSGGTCSYALKAVGAACNDGDACTLTDACDAEGDCAGAAKSCLTPPADHCEDANTAVSYDEAGFCGPEGECVYDETPDPCEFGCDDETGKCKADPCAGVTCNTPPAGGCYESFGTCSDVTGECNYAPKSQGAGCDDGDACTKDDECNGDGACNGTALEGTDADNDLKVDECDEDDDGDGVADTADNCPVTANADQKDADGDGTGDLCDSTPNGTNNGGGGTTEEPPAEGCGCGSTGVFGLLAFAGLAVRRRRR